MWIPEAIKFNISVFFVIGEPHENKKQIDLESEALEYKDIIQFGFKDSYYNLTLKHIALIRWAYQKCPNATYVMKTDDDALINIGHLVKNLHTFETGMTGYIHLDLNPKRSLDDPYLNPECVYPDRQFPVYILGGAYLMTRDIIPPLLRTLEQYSGSVIEMDDILISGILAEKAGIKRYNSGKFVFTGGCDSNNFCFMFNSIALFQCSDAEDSIKSWYKWKATTLESCNLTVI
jgi:hypothetical protein